MTKTYVAIETEVGTKVDVVTQLVLMEEKGRSRDKSNSSKRKLSRHLNTKRKCLMSQPRDDLSHQRLNVSRHNRKIASWAVFNFALNLITTHILSLKLKRDERK